MIFKKSSLYKQKKSCICIRISTENMLTLYIKYNFAVNIIYHVVLDLNLIRFFFLLSFEKDKNIYKYLFDSDLKISFAT